MMKKMQNILNNNKGFSMVMIIIISVGLLTYSVHRTGFIKIVTDEISRKAAGPEINNLKFEMEKKLLNMLLFQPQGVCSQLAPPTSVQDRPAAGKVDIRASQQNFNWSVLGPGSGSGFRGTVRLPDTASLKNIVAEVEIEPIDIHTNGVLTTDFWDAAGLGYRATVEFTFKFKAKERKAHFVSTFPVAYRGECENISGYDISLTGAGPSAMLSDSNYRYTYVTKPKTKRKDEVVSYDYEPEVVPIRDDYVTLDRFNRRMATWGVFLYNNAGTNFKENPATGDVMFSNHNHDSNKGPQYAGSLCHERLFKCWHEKHGDSLYQYNGSMISLRPNFGNNASVVLRHNELYACRISGVNAGTPGTPFWKTLAETAVASDDCVKLPKGGGYRIRRETYTNSGDRGLSALQDGQEIELNRTEEELRYLLNYQVGNGRLSNSFCRSVVNKVDPIGEFKSSGAAATRDDYMYLVVDFNKGSENHKHLLAYTNDDDLRGRVDFRTGFNFNPLVIGYCNMKQCRAAHAAITNVRVDQIATEPIDSSIPECFMKLRDTGATYDDSNAGKVETGLPLLPNLHNAYVSSVLDDYTSSIGDLKQASVKSNRCLTFKRSSSGVEFDFKGCNSNNYPSLCFHGGIFKTSTENKINGTSGTRFREASKKCHDLSHIKFSFNLFTNNEEFCGHLNPKKWLKCLVEVNASQGSYTLLAAPDSSSTKFSSGMLFRDDPGVGRSEAENNNHDKRYRDFYEEICSRSNNICPSGSEQEGFTNVAGQGLFLAPTAEMLAPSHKSDSIGKALNYFSYANLLPFKESGSYDGADKDSVPATRELFYPTLPNSREHIHKFPSGTEHWANLRTDSKGYIYAPPPVWQGDKDSLLSIFNYSKPSHDIASSGRYYARRALHLAENDLTYSAGTCGSTYDSYLLHHDIRIKGALPYSVEDSSTCNSWPSSGLKALCAKFESRAPKLSFEGIRLRLTSSSSIDSLEDARSACEGMGYQFVPPLSSLGWIEALTMVAPNDSFLPFPTSSSGDSVNHVKKSYKINPVIVALKPKDSGKIADPLPYSTSIMDKLEDAYDEDEDDDDDHEFIRVERTSLGNYEITTRENSADYYRICFNTKANKVTVKSNDDTCSSLAGERQILYGESANLSPVEEVIFSLTVDGILDNENKSTIDIKIAE